MGSLQEARAFSEQVLLSSFHRGHTETWEFTGRAQGEQMKAGSETLNVGKSQEAREAKVIPLPNAQTVWGHPGWSPQL